VENPPDHAVPQLGDALHNILNGQPEWQKAGILDLDPVIKYSNADGRSLLSVVPHARMAFMSASRIATRGTDQRSSLRMPSMVDFRASDACVRMQSLLPRREAGTSGSPLESSRRVRFVSGKATAWIQASGTGRTCSLPNKKQPSNSWLT